MQSHRRVAFRPLSTGELNTVTGGAAANGNANANGANKLQQILNLLKQLQGAANGAANGNANGNGAAKPNCK